MTEPPLQSLDASGKGRIFWITETGRQAKNGDDSAVPSDYRRILALVEPEAHIDVIRSALLHYPAVLIDEWLAELEELGFLESASAGADLNLDFTDHFAQLSASTGMLALGEDAARIESDMHSAGETLAREGVWIAADRLENRPLTGKPAADTVALIVEDDPDQLALADLRVSMAGYSVRRACSAHELVEELNVRGLPDILLLDVMLPDGDGFHILARLRRHAKLALLPVVMLTAKDDPHEIRRGLELGADAYITKPYSKAILADTIRRVLKSG